MQDMLSVSKFSNILCVLFSDLNYFVDQKSYNRYTFLQQHLKSIEDSCQNLQKDTTLKKFRLDLQVNMTVYNEDLIVMSNTGSA
jgi:hypothetical protein